MFTRLRAIRSSDAAGLIAVGIVITLVLSGTAMAVTDTSFTYNSVQTGYLMVGPGDLVPDDNGSADAYALSGALAESGGIACFVAGVHLPQGSSVTSVRSSYSSGNITNFMYWFTRDNPVTGDSRILVNGNVPDDLGQRRFVNDAVPTDRRLVNNALYAYTYRVCIGYTTNFYGARIAYQYTSAGD